MRPEDIKQGRFYRFRDSNAIYAILFEWPRHKEYEYVLINRGCEVNPETFRAKAKVLAKKISCEVVPIWINVENKNSRECRKPGFHRFNSTSPDEKCIVCGVSLEDVVKGKIEEEKASDWAASLLAEHDEG